MFRLPLSAYIIVGLDYSFWSSVISFIVLLNKLYVSLYASFTVIFVLWCRVDFEQHIILMSIALCLFPCFQLDDPSIFPAVIVEPVLTADPMQVYSGLESDEVPSNIMAESSLGAAEEQMVKGDLGLSGKGPITDHF